GYVYESKLGLEDEFHKWIDPVSIRLLYLSYCAYAQKRGERHPLHQGTLEKFLDEKMGWDRTQPRAYDAIVGEHLRGGKEPKVVKLGRQRCYQVGTLAEARAAFEMISGLSVESSTDDLPVLEDEDAVVIAFE